MSRQFAPQGRPPVVEILDPMIVEILRRKTPQERLQQAFDMWESARVIVHGAIAQEHPEWTEQQVLREVANRISHGATERIPR